MDSADNLANDRSTAYKRTIVHRTRNGQRSVLGTVSGTFTNPPQLCHIYAISAPDSDYGDGLTSRPRDDQTRPHAKATRAVVVPRTRLHIGAEELEAT